MATLFESERQKMNRSQTFGDGHRSAFVVPAEAVFCTVTRVAIVWLVSSIGFHNASHATELEIPNGKKTVVYVEKDDVFLSSGPSKDHYATLAVDAGVSLDAYLKTDDGWIGVRPPAGSFSWIQASDAYLLPGGSVIEITNPKAVSWIGTQFGKAERYGWQVELNQGEQLAVLGESTRQDEHGNKALWYKVKPPAGEYRWIHESNVTSDPAIAKRQGKGKPVQSASEDQDEAVESRATSSTDGNPVVAAAYQEEVVAQEVLSGDVFDDQLPGPTTIVEGPITEIVDGGVLYEEGPPASSSSLTGGMFSGWHAFEFDDDGLHFRLLERKLGKRGAMTDPLEWDPYSLTMPKRVNTSPPTRVPAGVTPRRTGVYERSMMQSNSGYQPPQPLDGGRPWRHPSTLRANRMNGYAGVSGEPLQGRSRREVLNSIRENVNDLGGSLGALVDGVGNRFGGSEGDIAKNDDAGAAEAARLGFRSTESPPMQLESSRMDRSGYGAAGAYSPYNATKQEVDWYGVTREAKRSEIGTGVRNGGIPATPGASYSEGPRAGQDAAFVSPDLRALQVRLSEMVSQPPGLWNLPSIVERAKYFVDNGQTALERGQARLLLERVAEFENHARRTAFVPGVNYRADAGQFPSPVPASSGVGPVQTAAYYAGNSTPVQPAGYQAPRSPAASVATSQANASFDATGYLVPVMGGSIDQPSHALADERGAIIAYVTGLPGMNLDLYLNKPVGVVGLRGYLPKLQKGHVQVERVVEFR
ncbi:MAG: hypothetical protein ACE361_25835 [Aureliella sp.]